MSLTVFLSEIPAEGLCVILVLCAVWGILMGILEDLNKP